MKKSKSKVGANRNQSRNQWKDNTGSLSQVLRFAYAKDSNFIEVLENYLMYLTDKRPTDINRDVYELFVAKPDNLYAYIRYMADNVYCFGVLHSDKIKKRRYTVTDLFNLVTTLLVCPKEQTTIKVRDANNAKEWKEAKQRGYKSLLASFRKKEGKVKATATA